MSIHGAERKLKNSKQSIIFVCVGGRMGFEHRTSCC
jgi:hypothetical protein